MSAQIYLRCFDLLLALYFDRNWIEKNNTFKTVDNSSFYLICQAMLLVNVYLQDAKLIE